MRSTIGPRQARLEVRSTIGPHQVRLEVRSTIGPRQARVEIASLTTGNLEKMSIQDKRHFDTSMEDRKSYIIETLKLRENKLIDTEDKLDKVIKLFLKYWGILDINGDRLAKFRSKEKLEINTTGEPIACRTRFVNPILAKAVKNIIEDWVKRGIAVPTTSPWQSPLVIVPKKTPPYIRVAIDYRKVNAVTTSFY